MKKVFKYNIFIVLLTILFNFNAFSDNKTLLYTSFTENDDGSVQWVGELNKINLINNYYKLSISGTQYISCFYVTPSLKKLQQIDFNTQNKLLKIQYLGKQGEVNSQIDFIYDKQLLTERIEINKKENSKLISKYFYNKDSYVSEIKIFDDDDPIPQIRKTFDFNKQMLKSKETLFDYSNNPIGFYEYEYTNNGLVSLIKEYDKDKIPTWKKQYKYNKSGKLIEEAYFRSAQFLEWMYQYDYDKKDRRIKHAKLDENYKIIWCYTYEYNDSDDIVKETFLNKVLTKNYQIFYTYNKSHNLIKKETFNHKEKLDKCSQYYWNKNGLLETEKVYLAGHNIRYKIKYIYKGEKKIEEISYSSKNIIQQKVTFNDDDSKNCEISYNDKGKMNWKCTYYNGINKPKDWHYFDDNEKLSFYYNYLYDDEERTLEETKFTSDGICELKKVFTYDSNGNLESRKHYDKNGKLVYQFPE